MERGKKLNRKKIIVCIFSLINIFLISVFARYVLTQNNDFFSKTKEFYFYSDKLAEDSPLYRIENWSGIDDYTIIINVNSNQNNILSAEYEINYQIEFTCSDNVLCQLSKQTGTIPASSESDTFSLKIMPNTQFDTGDIVNITITANATSPYEKVISAEFQLVVGQEKISYEIIDESKRPYLDLNITNTLSYYIISQSFDSYVAGNKISREVYLDLSATDKEKCYSSLITLQFNPEYVLLDMTNANYINATQVTKTLIDGYQYINGITFKLDAITGTRVRFYKKDIVKDYTYPNSDELSIITVTSI